MKIKQLILTFGSARQSRELSKFVKSDSFKIVHIVEDRGDGYAKAVESLTSEALKVIRLNRLLVKAVVSLGRATVIEGIPNIIECWKNVKRCNLSLLDHALFLGPSYMAGKYIPDKWTAAELFSLLGLPIAKSQHIDLSRKFPNSLSYPCVLKPTRFTGGAGMSYIENFRDFTHAKNKLKKLGETHALISEYVHGIETSIEIMRLGNKVFIYPPGTKQATDTSLNHADNKIKIYGYLRRLPKLEHNALTLVEALDVQGLFSLEGIVYNRKSLAWKITEAAPRVTGNLPMEEASVGEPAFQQMANYIQNGKWQINTKHIQVAIETPVYVHKEYETVSAFLKHKWVKRAVLDDLSALPGSNDHRKRIRVGFIAGKGKDLFTRCNMLERECGDNTIVSRITNAVHELNDFFGDYVINPSQFEL